jgi:hypothetical protein
MNAAMRVLTPEEKWHAGRQADAFFGLLNQYSKLLEDHNKLKEENVRLRNSSQRGKSGTAIQQKAHAETGKG